MTGSADTLKFSIPTAFYAIFAYALLLPLSFLLVASIWANKVSDVLYVCTDSVGGFDFIRPFVHAVHGDAYYVPVWRVYCLWYLFIAGAFLAPAFSIWL